METISDKSLPVSSKNASCQVKNCSISTRLQETSSLVIFSFVLMARMFEQAVSLVVANGTEIFFHRFTGGRSGKTYFFRHAVILYWRST